MGNFTYNMSDFLIFSTIFIFGLFFAVWYGYKTKGFRWSEYIALLIFPLMGIVWLTYKFGSVILFIYFSSAILGTFLEGFLGWSYHKALGSRLWEYKRLDISGYTSLLSVPFWGIAGTLFFLLVMSFDI